LRIVGEYGFEPIEVTEKILGPDLFCVLNDMMVGDNDTGRPASSAARGALFFSRMPFTRTPSPSIVTRSPPTPATYLISAAVPAGPNPAPR
jgi:hypothetical protein